ncbi:type II toxin-antitoxin system HigB family toxin [Tychonema bourrellyi]|uniref:type II toxin-antitoxin system HigB family toxin n=1 Tax=Tychonema bourrellyi TaxID=54313 RepID=UPI003CCBD32A
MPALFLLLELALEAPINKSSKPSLLISPFNIKGNRYRLIVDLIYDSQRIYIKYVLTHAEYDKDEWKNDPYF